MPGGYAWIDVSCGEPMIREAIISVTNRCDARCQMCNIWKLRADELLTVEDYGNLPGHLENVGITGGEALLRPDIAEVVHAIYESTGKPRVIIATNGFRPDMTVKQIESIRKHVPNVGLMVSVDGIGEAHNHNRGVPGVFEHTMATLRGLLSIGITNLRMAFVVTAETVSQLPAVYDLAGSLGVELTVNVAQNSDVYFKVNDTKPVPSKELEKSFAYVIDRNLRSFTPKKWGRAYYELGLLFFARHGERMTGCSAATDFFFLSPQGDVFPCTTLSSKLGNIHTQKFSTLWEGEEARAARSEVSHCRACWMMCTARTELKKAPMKALAWIAREKIAHHFWALLSPARNQALSPTRIA